MFNLPGTGVSDRIRGKLSHMDTKIQRVADAQESFTLRDLEPEPFPEGNELLSQEIDAITYGDRDAVGPIAHGGSSPASHLEQN